MTFRDLLPVFEEKQPKSFTHRFTVFTPIYNCEDTIERVYNCLTKQTFKDFEWLIINDGSSDNSHEVITAIIEKSSIKITYINNEKNKHKMGCFMQAINLADGDFFLTFDADDECVDEALEVFNNEYNAIPQDLKPQISAVTALCVNQHGQQIGDAYPKQPFYSNTFKSYAIDRVLGEKWGFTKTNVLRQISYPKAFVSHGFMPEGLIWNTLALHGYITKYVNKPLRIYYVGVGESITSSGFEKTALGNATQYIANFNWFLKSYWLKAPMFFIKNLYFLLRISKYLNFNLKNYTTSIDSSVIKFFFVLLWPIRKYLK
nr:glycosyltransferase family 2 protein [uncultured Psychroserpens sp.]